MSKCENKNQTELPYVCAVIRKSEGLGHVTCRTRDACTVFYCGQDVVGVMEGGKVSVLRNGKVCAIDIPHIENVRTPTGRPGRELKRQIREAAKTANAGGADPKTGSPAARMADLEKQTRDAKKLADSWIPGSEIHNELSRDAEIDDRLTPLPMDGSAIIMGTNGHSYLMGSDGGSMSAIAEVTDDIAGIARCVEINNSIAARNSRARSRRHVSEEVSFALSDQRHRGRMQARQSTQTARVVSESVAGHAAAPETLTNGSDFLGCITRCDGGSLVQIMDEETMRYEKAHAGDKTVCAGTEEPQTACVEPVGDIHEDADEDAPAQKPRDSYTRKVKTASIPRLKVPRVFKPRVFDPEEVSKNAKPEAHELASRLIAAAGMDPAATASPDVPYEDETVDIRKACASLDADALRRIARDLRHVGCHGYEARVIRELALNPDTDKTASRLIEAAGMDPAATASPDVPYKDETVDIRNACASLDADALKRIYGELEHLGHRGYEMRMIRKMSAKGGRSDTNKTASRLIEAAGMDPDAAMPPEVPYEDAEGPNILSACSSLDAAALKRLHGDLQRFKCDGPAPHIVRTLLKQRGGQAESPQAA